MIGPNLIFGADSSFAFRTNNGGTMGPYQHGSNLYVSGYYVTTPEAIQANLGIFKSTDQGATWTRVAAGNSPQVNWISDYWVSGNVIYFCYVNIVSNPDVGFLNLASFDMSTDTLTIIATGGPSLNLFIHLSNYEFSFTPPVLLAEMVRLSNGTFVIEYGHSNNISGIIEILMVTYSAGWGSPQLVSSNSLANSNSVIGIGLAANDKAYLLWLNGTDGNVYSSVFSSGTLAAPVSVLHPTAYVWDTVRTTGIYLPIHDILVFNFESFNSVNTNKVELLLISAASTNSPSYSLSDTGFLTTMVNNTGRQALSYNPTETTFTLYFLDQSNPASVNLKAATASALTGPWSVAMTVWNNATNPPSPSPGSPGGGSLPIETLYSRLLSDGATQAFILGFSAFSGDISGLAYYLSLTPSLSLVCPIQNTATLGVPYSGTLVATGGTPPYSWSLIGGALPPGLVLNPSTGTTDTISGTPTETGNFSFTIQVVDSNGLTAQVTCFIMIPTAPLQPGTPCSAAGVGPPQPTDTHFELQRLYVTMKPAPRIPVRGS